MSANLIGDELMQQSLDLLKNEKEIDRDIYRFLSQLKEREFEDLALDDLDDCADEARFVIMDYAQKLERERLEKEAQQPTISEDLEVLQKSLEREEEVQQVEAPKALLNIDCEEEQERLRLPRLPGLG